MSMEIELYPGERLSMELAEASQRHYGDLMPLEWQGIEILKSLIAEAIEYGAAYERERLEIQDAREAVIYDKAYMAGMQDQFLSQQDKEK